jgi:hypothetical protein
VTADGGDGQPGEEQPQTWRGSPGPNVEVEVRTEGRRIRRFKMWGRAGGRDLADLFAWGLPSGLAGSVDVRLEDLRELAIQSGGLTAVPPDVMGLTGLELLDLSFNPLVSLPPELAGLTGLRTLRLAGIGLTGFPAEIAQLTGLASLTMDRNLLGALPPDVGDLVNLTDLSLRRTGLSDLPVELARLAQLENLQLADNQLSRWPPVLQLLPRLRHLCLAGNGLTGLPVEIGRLVCLETLVLCDNRLTALPHQLGRLREDLALNLRYNPLAKPLLELAERGVSALFAHLRSLDGAHPQYEARVLLVGEGSAGKTSLVAALRGEPFVDGGSTTHGIELRALSLPHPSIDRRMTLNVWDFGGREVHRITDQLFFSGRALYLVVWRPREGQVGDAIESWCRRIRLRAGADARIMIVATHADERIAELDYPALRRRFGHQLAGHHAVDNRSRRGVAELIDAIAAEAARLPHMGELISERWMAASLDLLARPEPRVPYAELAVTCARHGMDGPQTRSFAGLQHDLGHIVHYAEDDGLHHIVVLRPEWLTRAIGCVLEDRVTRESGGILDHARLPEIWGDLPDDASYPAEDHPYFIRLMERFDVSHRLPEEEGAASMIGPLVPWERPELPWDGRTAGPWERSLSVRCRLSDQAPGLVAWLTVRNHRFSVHRHWQRGVFLAHREHGSEALIELVRDDELELQVRGASPGYFFSILRDSLEHLITRRWPDLSHELLVPCPAVTGDVRCGGYFKLRVLETFRERGRAEIACHDCGQDQDVARLLTGFTTPELVDSVDVRGLAEQVGHMRSEVAEVANRVRGLQKLAAAEVADCPRLFTLAEVPARALPRVWQRTQRLTLWCEHPGAWHPCPEAVYELTATPEWMVRVGPYAALVLHTLHLFIPVAALAVYLVLDEPQMEHARHELELMRSLSEQLPDGVTAHLEHGLATSRGDAGLSPAEGAGLRALRAMLLKKDAARFFGGLRRVQAHTGDLLWVCPKHHQEYDPGLPKLPAG